jgi:hypothetical protein
MRPGTYWFEGCALWHLFFVAFHWHAWSAEQLAWS